jgi:membrane protein DedA with SNARE-associated domain
MYAGASTAIFYTDSESYKIVRKISTIYPIFLLEPLRQLPFFGYGAIFVGTFLEGEAVVYTTAFLVHREVFNIFLATLVAYAGVIAGDVAWYRLGARIRNHPSRWGHKVLNLTDKFDVSLHEKTTRTIFISKFSYGIHHLLMARAGYIGVPQQHFIRKDLIVSIVWLGIVGGLGYLSSASLSHVGRRLKYVEIGIVIGLVFFFFVLGWLRYLLKKILEYRAKKPVVTE